MTDDREAAHVPRRRQASTTSTTAFRCATTMPEGGELAIITAEAADGLAVVKVAGEIDLRTAGRLRAGLLDRAEAGFRNIILDFQQVRFCDATGLGALVAAHNTLARQGGGLRLAGVRPAQRRLFRITGLDRALGLHDSVPGTPGAG
jgi:anti-sigma B factor antagonist